MTHGEKGLTALDAAAHLGAPAANAEGFNRPRHPKELDITIRLPRDGDWPAVEALVRKHHGRTAFADIPISDRKLTSLVDQARNPLPHQCLLVAECKGCIVGLAWFSAGEYMLGEGGVMTTTHLIAVDTDRCRPFRSAKVFIKLLRGIVAWSKTRGARQVLVHVTTGTAIKQTDRLMRAGGGVCLGGSYVVGAVGL